jgi:hypothetical protein
MNVPTSSGPPGERQQHPEQTNVAGKRLTASMLGTCFFQGDHTIEDASNGTVAVGEQPEETVTLDRMITHHRVVLRFQTSDIGAKSFMLNCQPVPLAP